MVLHYSPIITIKFVNDILPNRTINDVGEEWGFGSHIYFVHVIDQPITQTQRFIQFMNIGNQYAGHYNNLVYINDQIAALKFDW